LSFEVGVGFVRFEELISDHVAEVILLLTFNKSGARGANVLEVDPMIRQTLNG
jgi:hypothetical protein